MPERYVNFFPTNHFNFINGALVIEKCHIAVSICMMLRVTIC
jgi:hypothetical protein